MEKKLKIYSVFHKLSLAPKSNFIEPLQVGCALTNSDFGFRRDDIGENISFKNDTYCELTGLYWIWKHLNQIDADYIGLCHYRRYFTLPNIVPAKLFKRKKIDTRNVYIDDLTETALSRATSDSLKEKLIHSLQEGAVVVPNANVLNIDDEKIVTPIKIHYIYSHVREDWEIMESAVKRLFPEYADTWQKFERLTKMHCCNMFIGNKSFINDYCTWLYTIEDELEKHVKLSEYPYQRRIFGFFSERLLNLYLLHNKIKTAQFPVLELK